MCRQCNHAEQMQRAGLQATPAREALLRVFADAEGPLSAKEAIGLALGRGTAMNKVTAYRNLHRFVELGLLHVLVSPDGVERFCPAEETLHPAHAHFACRICARLVCMPWNVSLASRREQTVGRIEDTQVLCRGVCVQCLQQATGA